MVYIHAATCKQTRDSCQSKPMSVLTTEGSKINSFATKIILKNLLFGELLGFLNYRQGVILALEGGCADYRWHRLLLPGTVTHKR